jgi:hypothetical protein
MLTWRVLLFRAADRDGAGFAAMPSRTLFLLRTKRGILNRRPIVNG